MIPRFLAAYPAVQLQLNLISGQYDPLRVDADLLIQTGPLIDSAAGCVKLGSVPQGVFAARKFSKEHGSLERPEALQGLAGASLSGRPGPTAWELTRRQERVRVDLVTRLIVPDPILHQRGLAEGSIGTPLRPGHRRSVSVRVRINTYMIAAGCAECICAGERTFSSGW